MRAQLVAGRQVEPGEHYDLIARLQVLGTLRDLLIEADPRPRRAFALVRRIVEDLQGRLHPADRHQGVARLHNNSLLVGRGHRPRGCPVDPSALAPCWGGGLVEAEQIGGWRALIWRSACCRPSGSLVSIVLTITGGKASSGDRLHPRLT